MLDSAVEEAFFPFLHRELETFDLQVRDIDIVANTHMHADHCGMNNQIVKFSQCSVMSFTQGLHDDFVIDGGDYSLRVIHTPGHTQDSISFLELSSKTLFSGDAIEGRGSRYAGVALYENPAELLSTIEKVRSLVIEGAVKQIYLGHAYYGTNGILQNDEILPFLDLSRKTVFSYGKFIGSLPKNLSLEEAAELFRQEFSVSEEILNKNAARMTLRAHLHTENAL